MVNTLANRLTPATVIILSEYIESKRVYRIPAEALRKIADLLIQNSVIVSGHSNEVEHKLAQK